MNLPNRLTLARILLIPLILIFLLPLSTTPFWQNWQWINETAGRAIACILFLIAALSDILDGRLARKLNMVTNFGKFFDSIADKMLVLSVLIVLVQLGRIHSLIAIIIVCREFAVTGIRLIAIEQGQVIAADRLGKLKTVTQIVALLMIMAEPLLPALWATGASYNIVLAINNSVLTLAVLLTVISGLNYGYRNRSLFK